MWPHSVAHKERAMFIYEAFSTIAVGIALIQWGGVLLQPPRTPARFDAQVDAAAATVVAAVLLVAIAIN